MGVAGVRSRGAWLPLREEAEFGGQEGRRALHQVGVCEMIASELFHQEYQIIEIAENVCNLKKEEADWILKIDLVENGDKLELVEQDTEGICNAECKTIERACQEVMGYSDTDVAEYIYKSKPQLDSLVEFLCKDLTSACDALAPPLPKNCWGGIHA
ncbi:hypothetical protein MLD38_006570 [Melastoma candidum]|uniref:Uncharacterized protein n=1 Tax=Melastoma candidum TaxID=119954 RepID=A0ACB9RPJ3_9MYRT|nr:hypothetical protein MLD38_006570 [Melastoma candidum]